MAILPYSTNVPFARLPAANFVIVAAVIATFVAQVTGGDFRALVLDGWGADGLFGYMWIHAGLLHVGGNMLFLWVFGNAPCARVGNLTFAAVYLVAGVAGGVLHLTLSAGPAVGASAAVNGIVGLYLVLYPSAPVSCFYWLGLWVGTFEVRGIWLILLWFAFDIWGALSGGGGTAYWAHIGGFVVGVGAGLVLLASGVVTMARHELSLLQWIGVHDKPD